MNNAILILGESGSGKSTSIRTLAPEETFILNVIGKPLPFRGSGKAYTRLSPDGTTGNYYCTDEYPAIHRTIAHINRFRPDIKNLVIDDFGYLLTNHFMRNAMVKGYDKYSEIGQQTFNTLQLLNSLRDDLFVFVMMHTEFENGKLKPKTVGKMVDQYICIEGKFTHVLHAVVIDNKYQFITQNNGVHMAKSPMGLFDTLTIDNDLKFVTDKIKTYLNEDID